jgi:hypothetical protein
MANFCFTPIEKEHPSLGLTPPPLPLPPTLSKSQETPLTEYTLVKIILEANRVSMMQMLL